MSSPETSRKVPSSEQKLLERIGSSEARMIRRRRQGDRGYWRPMALIGVVGWTVVVPMLIGIAIGTWIDHRWPSRFSWTLMLLVAGLGIGCVMAWTRIKREQEDR
jgi:ATP synthase protein I